MGVITVEIPQPIKKTFRIEDVNAASALLRQLEDTSSGLLEELSGEIDRWENEQDTATSGAVSKASTLRKKMESSIDVLPLPLRPADSPIPLSPRVLQAKVLQLSL